MQCGRHSSPAPHSSLLVAVRAAHAGGRGFPRGAAPARRRATSPSSLSPHVTSSPSSSTHASHYLIAILITSHHLASPHHLITSHRLIASPPHPFSPSGVPLPSPAAAAPLLGAALRVDNWPHQVRLVFRRECRRSCALSYLVIFSSADGTVRRAKGVASTTPSL